MISRMHLKIEKEGRAAKQTAITIAQEECGTPLRTAQSTRFLAARVGILSQAGNKFNSSSVVKALEDLHQRTIDAKRGRQRSDATTVCVEIGAKIQKRVGTRAIARFNIQRRKSSLHTAVGVTGKSVDGIELIALAWYQSAAEKSIEEVLSPDRDRERFKRLTGN